MDSDDVIGARVRELRILRGFSQRELAERVPDFTARIVMKIEQGTRPLRLSEAAAIAEILDVSVEDLLDAPNQLGEYEELATALRIHLEKTRTAAVGLSVLYQSYNNLIHVNRSRPPLGSDSDPVLDHLVDTAHEVISQTSRLEAAMQWATRRLADELVEARVAVESQQADEEAAPSWRDDGEDGATF